MTTRFSAWLCATLVLGAMLTLSCSRPPAGVAPEQVADYIHTVIQADRTIYTREVVNRLQNEQKVIKATEHFKEEKTLPLPAQMLRMGAQLSSEAGGLRYALISQWPINKANGAKTEFEAAGLEALATDPGEPYRKYETVAGKRYFMALYPDKAVAPACVTCHNDHPESPRKDYKLGDVMGAVVIALPLER
jgi:hypothetical protein